MSWDSIRQTFQYVQWSRTASKTGMKPKSVTDILQNLLYLRLPHPQEMAASFPQY